MTRPIVREHNLETNQVIDREMNDAEFAQWQIDKAAAEAKQAEAEAKREAALSKLAALGLTADDLKALGL